MSKHTPGPWEINALESDNPLIYNDSRCQNASRDNQNWRVAVVCEPAWNTEAGWSEARATANLIAAAPDLLTAAETALGILEKCHEGWPPTTDELTSPILLLIAALAKARGEEE